MEELNEYFGSLNKGNNAGNKEEDGMFKYYKEGKAKYKMIYSEQKIPGYDILFDKLDRKTQFSVLFSSFSRREFEGLCASGNGNLEEAKKIFEECLSRAEQLDVDLLRAKSYSGFLSIADKSGSTEDQRKYLNLIKKYSQFSDKKIYFSAKNKEAMTYMDDGKFNEAESALLEAMETMPPDPNDEEKITYENVAENLATITRLQNRYPEAIAWLDKAEKLLSGIEKFEVLGRRASIYFAKAVLYMSKAWDEYNIAKAKFYLSEFKKINPFPEAAYFIESMICFEEKKWKDAAQLAYKAASELYKKGWYAAVSRFQLMAVKCFIELGDVKNAELQLNASLQVLQKIGPPDSLASAELLKARLKSLKGDADGAWNDCLISLNGIEEIIRYNKDIYSQQNYILDKKQFYDHSFQIALSKGGSESIIRAWTIAERSKGFYLMQLLASKDVNIFEGIDKTEAAEFQKMEDKIEELELRAANAVRDQEKLISELTAARTEKKKMLSDLMNNNPRWASIKNSSSLNIEELVKKKQDCVYLCYYWQEQAEGMRMFIFFNLNGKALCHWEDWTRDEFDELVFERSKLFDVSSKALSSTLFNQRLASNLLPQKLISVLPEGKKILISPHGVLKDVPLHALEVSDGCKLIERNPVMYIPTLSLLSIPDETANAESVLVTGCVKDAFGDAELWDVEEEVNEIGKLWNKKEVDAKLIQEKSTLKKSGLPLNEWNKYKIIHIGCHGIFNQEDPFESALRLGKDSVRASEFFNAKLSAELVVFSACDIGKKKESKHFAGDEWVGMYLPLFYAGAKKIVSSLWAANSRFAKEFMITIHKHLAQGDEAEVAFQRAVVSLKNKPVKFWANWTLTGFKFN